MNWTGDILTFVDRPLASYDALVELGGSALFRHDVTPELREAGYDGPLVKRGGLLQMGPHPDPARWPLLGQRIVVTRESEQGKEFRQQLSDLGAQVVNLPVLAFEAIPWTLDQVEYDWLVFTSANGVRFFFERLLELGRDVRALGPCHLAAIGPATATALGKLCLRVDLVPSEYVAEGMLESFRSHSLEGKRVLLARAQEARDVLPEGLRAMGADITVLPVYRTVLPSGGTLEEADLVTFTSSSSVKNFCRLCPGQTHLPVLSIGPITTQTAREHGFTNITQAARYTTEGMLETIVSLASSRESEQSDGNALEFEDIDRAATGK